MFRRSLDLVLIVFISLLGIITYAFQLGDSGHPGSLSTWFIPFGILFALFIPGYSIAIGLLPRFDGAVVLLLSFGLSIAIDVLGGLLLNLTSWGLRPASWILLLGGIAIIGSFNTAIRRRLQLAFEPDFEIRFQNWNLRNAIFFGIAGIILALAIGSTLADTKANVSFTQLWAIPSSVNGSYAITIGINNKERQTTTYELYVEAQGVQLQKISNIVLKAGEEWTTVLELDQRPQDVVNISLYLADNTKNSYRTALISPTSFDSVVTPTPELLSP